MNISNTSSVQRLTFLITSILAFIGIYLSGYDQVHWFLYVVPVVYLFSATTGFCPGIAVSRLLLRPWNRVGSTRPTGTV
jgi:hypothetical protein